MFKNFEIFFHTFIQFLGIFSKEIIRKSEKDMEKKERK